MPTDRILLVGSLNQRGLDGNATLVLNQDQRFLNIVFDVVQNAVTGKATVYAAKRPGWGVDTVPASGSVSTGLLRPQTFNTTISAFGDPNSTIYLGTTSVGTITGRALHMMETLIYPTVGTSVGYIMIRSSDGTGWYYGQGASDTLTFIGDTHTNTVIDSLPSTTGMYVGQAISGTGVTAGTRIASITSTVAIVVDTATTATNADVTFTITPIAKIIDTDFVATGSSISAFVEMDGFLFYCDTGGRLFNSDENSVISWSASGYTSPNMAPDPPKAVARAGKFIIVLGGSSKEGYYNQGSRPSPLLREPGLFERIGVLDQRSVTMLEDDIYFVSSPSAGDIGVHRIRGAGKSVKVSTPAVDKILGTISSVGSVFASAFKLGGYQYVALYVSVATEGASASLLLESGSDILLEDSTSMLLEAGATESTAFERLLIYNVGLNIWSEWDATEATYIVGIGSTTSNQILATSRLLTGGKIYTINPESAGELYQDDGSAYTAEIRTQMITHGTPKRKFVSDIELIGDTQSGGTVTLEYSDNDYSSWTTLGTFDLTVMRPRITPAGSYEGGRAYRLTHSYNGAWRAERLDITYTVAP